jgi:hypothetical protein
LTKGNEIFYFYAYPVADEGKFGEEGSQGGSLLAVASVYGRYGIEFVQQHRSELVF